MQRPSGVLFTTYPVVVVVLVGAVGGVGVVSVNGKSGVFCGKCTFGFWVVVVITV